MVMKGDNPRPLCIGNWKMNGTAQSLSEVETLIDWLEGKSCACEIVICPPATLIDRLSALVRESAITVGAQDCHSEPSGAFTGDISAEMIADAGGRYVIVGHSERRQGHGESDAVVRAKARACHRAGLAAVICIGETAEERAHGMTLDVVGGQLRGSLGRDADSAGTVIAYEPVWAIGSGHTPSPIEIATVHAHIREKVVQFFGTEAGHGIRILYGGSVHPENAREILSLEDVNGTLVGGASLQARTFQEVIRSHGDILSERAAGG